MSDEVVEMKEPNFQWQNLFLAAVKAAGGKITITDEDYQNPPTVMMLNDGSDGYVTFEVTDDE